MGVRIKMLDVKQTIRKTITGLAGGRKGNANSENRFIRLGCRLIFFNVFGCLVGIATAQHNIIHGYVVS